MTVHVFTVKSPLVQAMRYTEQTRAAIIEWARLDDTFIDDDGCECELLNLRLRVDGTHFALVRPGDWVVKMDAISEGLFISVTDEWLHDNYEAA